MDHSVVRPQGHIHSGPGPCVDQPLGPFCALGPGSFGGPPAGPFSGQGPWAIQCPKALHWPASRAVHLSHVLLSLPVWPSSVLGPASFFSVVYPQSHLVPKGLAFASLLAIQCAKALQWPASRAVHLSPVLLSLPVWPLGVPGPCIGQLLGLSVPPVPFSYLCP
jgi:hypothetical protein